MVIADTTRIRRAIRGVLGLIVLATLAAGLAPVALAAPSRTQRDLIQAEARRARTIEEREKVDTQRRNMFLDERSILSVLDRLDRRIEAARATIEQLQGEIVAVRENIALLREEITTLQEIRAERRRLVAARLRANYKINYMSRSGMFEVALHADDFQDLMVRLQYVSKIRQRDDAIIDRYLSDERRLSARKADVEAQQGTLIQRQAALRREEESLADERRQRHATLNTLRLDLHLKERAIREYDAAVRQVALLIARLERERSAEQRPSTRRPTEFRPDVSVIGSTGGEALVVPTVGAIRWPVDGEIIENVSTALEGVTIRCDREGRPVRAVLAGTVEYADWFNGLGYGKLIVLNHGKGMRSFYAHLQGFLVGQGDEVTQGHTIGTVGSTGSLVGAALYFEMRRHFDVISLNKDAN